jgi:electron transport complex protein RnfG
VLQHTPIWGGWTKGNEAAFKSQYIGKNPQDFSLEVKKDGGDVDALTGATITSRAFSDAVQLAFDMYMKGGTNE